MAENSNRQLAVLVLGMHRSGTSALAGVLNLLGVEFGSRLIEARAGVNDRGFWEHRDVLGLHERVYEKLGLSWDDIGALPSGWWRTEPVAALKQELQALLERDFSDAGLWGVKDPRLCRLLPLWVDVLRELNVRPKIVFIYRNPLEVAASLTRRDGSSTAHGLLLWLQHVLEAEYNSRGLDRAFVDYHDLLADWRRELGRIASRLGIQWPRVTADVEGGVGAFLDPALRHHRIAGTQEAVDSLFSRWVKELYETLQRVDTEGESSLKRRFSVIRREFDGAVPLVSGLLRIQGRRLSDAEKGLRQASDMLSHYETDVATLRQTLEDTTRGFEGAMAQLRERDGKLAETSERLEAGHAALEEAVHSLVRSGQDLAETRQALAEKDEQLASTRGELTSALTALAGVQKTLAQKEEAFASVRAEFDSAKVRLDRLTALAQALGEDPEVSVAQPPDDIAEETAEVPGEKVYESVINLLVDNNSHTKMIRCITEDAVDPGKRVLEVGCSSGYFGSALRKLGFEVWGVELSPLAAQRARTLLDHVFVGTVEDFLESDAFRGIGFDYIVFGDVLEHLTDPVHVLKKCRRILNPGGGICASIPNVAHNAVRAMLLEGRWDYDDKGIMDDTHLRFFTRDSIVDTFSGAGYKLQTIDPVFLPAEETGIRFNPTLLETVSRASFDAEQEVFQYALLAKPVVADEQAAALNLRFKSGVSPRILALLPLKEWSIGDIRIVKPLQELRKRFGGDVRTACVFDFDQVDLAWADTVVLQRESSLFVLDLMAKLQNQGKRIVFDIDDLLTEVPPFLSVYEHCQQIRPYLQEALRMADVVTVTTERLRREMQAYNRNVHVIPNCTYNWHEPVVHDQSAPEHPVNLLVASSDTVRVDFVVNVLRRLFQDEDLNLRLIGIGPPGRFLRDAGLHVAALDAMSHDQFKAFLATLENAVGIIPLDDSRFSGCKSAIKYIDYALAGIPTLCSAVPPYSDVLEDGHTGMLCANLEEDWYQALRRVATSAGLRRQLASEARQFALNEFGLSRSAAAWAEMLSSLQAGQGQLGSPLLAESRRFASRTRGILRQLARPRSYASVMKILHDEGLNGLRARLLRYF